MRLTRITLLLCAVTLFASAEPRTIGVTRVSTAPVAADVGDLIGTDAARSLPLSLSESLRALEVEGRQVAIARIGNTAAPAVRLLIRDISLPAGVRLYIYGRAADGTLASKAHGPYTGTGPLFSGEFWTLAIPGTEIVLEFQSDAYLPATSPLVIAAIEPAEAGETQPDEQGNGSETIIRTSNYRGVPLTHSVEDGWAVFEGDIVLGRADELPASGKSGPSARKDGLAITGSHYRWPGGIIPYAIDPTIPNQSRITLAVDHWNATMSGHIRLIPRTTETAFVYFVRAASPSTCSSSVGMFGYQQSLNVGDYCTSGNMIHEIGHAVGLWHEQGREDRNSYVKINWANIQAGTEHNFYQQIDNGDDVGAYNYGSIMHYPATAFSSNGLPTIETIPAGIAIGQRNGLNAGDVAALRVIYPAKPAGPVPTPGTVPVTIGSNPAGMPLVIDGVTTSSQLTVNWVPGSVHTVSAVNPSVTSGTRYTFAKWSDGGAHTHELIVPTSTYSLRADYTTAYKLSAGAVPVGTVSIWPAAADAFYATGSTVQVAASGPTGYCFAGWTGLFAGTPAATSLTMNSEYSIQANFQTGAITASPSVVPTDRSGGTYSIDVSANAPCIWKAASSESWVTIQSGTSGSGSGVVTIKVADGKKNRNRTAQITIGDAAVTIVQQ